MNSCYSSKLERNRETAKEIAQRTGKDVYIAKAKKLNKYKLIFSEEELTPNYEIIERIERSTT